MVLQSTCMCSSRGISCRVRSSGPCRRGSRAITSAWKRACATCTGQPVAYWSAGQVGLWAGRQSAAGAAAGGAGPDAAAGAAANARRRRAVSSAAEGSLRAPHPSTHPNPSTAPAVAVARWCATTRNNNQKKKAGGTPHLGILVQDPHHPLIAVVGRVGGLPAAGGQPAGRSSSAQRATRHPARGALSRKPLWQRTAGRGRRRWLSGRPPKPQCWQWQPGTR